jgi:hypothetical protein
LVPLSDVNKDDEIKKNEMNWIFSTHGKLRLWKCKVRYHLGDLGVNGKMALTRMLKETGLDCLDGINLR